MSELSWLGAERPEEAAHYWAENYPDMQDVAGNLARARAAGYRVVAHETLPERAWWDDYYDPLAARTARLREKYADDAEALAHLDTGEREWEMYRRYAAHYGYVFYVLAPD